MYQTHKILLAFICVFSSCLLLGQTIENSCSNPTYIEVLDHGTVCVDSNTTGSSFSDTNSCRGYTNGIVWYSYVTKTVRNNVILQPTGNNPLRDPVLSVRRKALCKAGNFSRCYTGIGIEAVEYNESLPLGEEIIIGVSGIEGEFTLCIYTFPEPEIEGNTCETALKITKKDSIDYKLLTPLTATGIQANCWGGPSKQYENNGYDFWMTFTPCKTGLVEWQVIPNGLGIELDWAMFDITDGCPIYSDHDDIAKKEIACNWNDGGLPNSVNPVGMNSDSETTCPTSQTTQDSILEYCPSIMVFSQRKYAIVISEFHAKKNDSVLNINWGGNFEIDTGICDRLKQQANKGKPFPNPTRGIVNIDSDFTQVFKASGKLILSSNINIIDLSRFSRGLYLFRAINHDQVIYSKVVLE